MNCPGCNTDNHSDALFCSGCGRALASVQTPPSVAVPAGPAPDSSAPQTEFTGTPAAMPSGCPAGPGLMNVPGPYPVAGYWPAPNQPYPHLYSQPFGQPFNLQYGYGGSYPYYQAYYKPISANASFNATLWIVLSISCAIMSLEIIPPLSGGLAVFFGFKATECKSKAGIPLMVISGIAMAAGLSFDAIAWFYGW